MKAISFAAPIPTYLLTLTMDGTGMGAVSGGGSYREGDTVSLAAGPTVGSNFTGWRPTPCAARFTMPAYNLTCTATFTLRTFTVTAIASGGGSITPSSQTVNYGATASFTVTPRNASWRISSVTGCGGALSPSGTTYITGPITADCTVNATFSPVTY